jgi:hypothetical protein
MFCVLKSYMLSVARSDGIRCVSAGMMAPVMFCVLKSYMLSVER